MNSEINDIFSVLTKPGSHIKLHNVRLLDVQPDPNGFESLIVEYQGHTRTVVGGSRWNEKNSRDEVGLVGYIVSVNRISGMTPEGACYFRAYIDPSLRRAPEFDILDAPLSMDGRQLEMIGWRCDRWPKGFLAPIGIIPGKDGAFVSDETVAVTLRIPPEFIRECRGVQRSPEEVLRGFIGDLAGIQNYTNNPRADGYTSHGSDERDYAENWLDRAYGMDRVNIDALEAADDERQEKQETYDELTGFLDDFIDNGGSAEELLSAVKAIVDKKTSPATE